MGTIAQLEADMIRERTRSRIKAAKAAGKHTGRPPFGFNVYSATTAIAKEVEEQVF